MDRKYDNSCTIINSKGNKSKSVPEFSQGPPPTMISQSLKEKRIKELEAEYQRKYGSLETPEERRIRQTKLAKLVPPRYAELQCFAPPGCIALAFPRDEKAYIDVPSKYISESIGNQSCMNPKTTASTSAIRGKRTSTIAFKANGKDDEQNFGHSKKSNKYQCVENQPSSFSSNFECKWMSNFTGYHGKQCVVAGFKTIDDVIGHIKNDHHAQLICQWTGCGRKRKPYYGKQQLFRHIRTVHLDEKLHQCAICDQTFSYKTYLTDHMRRHTGERPYVCLICHQGFSHKSTLTNHIRTHTGGRPHACSISKTFSQKSTLNRHMQTHTRSNKSQA